MEIFIGFIIGAVLGLTGAGGSIFAVPLLTLLMGIEITEAMGIALGAVSASAFIGAFRQHTQILWIPSLLLITGGIITAPLGKWASLFVNETLLAFGFSFIAMMIALRMLKQTWNTRNYTSHLRSSTPDNNTELVSFKKSQHHHYSLNLKRFSSLIIGGFGVGFTSGFFGVGGGFLIVPLLLFIGPFTMPQAVATSLTTISFISGSGFISHYLIASFSDLSVLINVLIAAVIGMLTSQKLNQYIDNRVSQIIFSCTLILVSFVLIVKQLWF